MSLDIEGAQPDDTSKVTGPMDPSATGDVGVVTPSTGVDATSQIETIETDAKTAIPAAFAIPDLQLPDITSEADKLVFASLDADLKALLSEFENNPAASNMMMVFLMNLHDIKMSMWDKFLDAIDEADEAEEVEQDVKNLERDRERRAELRAHIYKVGADMLHQLSAWSALDYAQALTQGSLERHESAQDQGVMVFARRVVRTLSDPEVKTLMVTHITAQFTRRL
jgi:hypothetical protein